MASGDGNWLVVQELLERGDPLFVEELRAIHDADRLAKFAAKWYQDRRSTARRLLFEYLKKPLNAYRHEGLVKRLFKLAEKNRDDETMAHFLVALDRSVRRKWSQRHRPLSRVVTDRSAAEELLKQAQDLGAVTARIDEWNGRLHVFALIPRDVLYVPQGTTMPRGKTTSGFWYNRTDLDIKLKWYGATPLDPLNVPEPYRTRLASFRLFSVHTRNYLRRRVWRYFRKLGVERPQLYVPILGQALKLYEDADAATGVNLLDNWSLLHILFHHSPALKAQTNGWTLQRGHNLKELAPAPIYPQLWSASPTVFFDLLKTARCRVVRQWALFYLRQTPELLRNAPFEDLFRLLNHDDPDVVLLVCETIANHPNVSKIGAERWLNLLESLTPGSVDAVCRLAEQHAPAKLIPTEALVRLACSRAVPLAKLGFRWLEQRTLTSNDLQVLWQLTEAKADVLRADLVRWARRQFSAATDFRPEWVLDYLDSRHAEVRAEGWSWLLDEARAHNDVEVWQKLLESPYDDVRLRLIDYLHRRYDPTNALRTKEARLSPESLRLVWASVLLNIHRGGRSKPKVVTQIVERLKKKPDEAPLLLPILKTALRSVRGPEWRAGLTGLVQWLQRQPEMAALVQEQVPELQMSASVE